MELPDPDLRVDYGERCAGSSNPMPIERREEYEQRIREAAKSKGGRGMEIFIR